MRRFLIGAVAAAAMLASAAPPAQAHHDAVCAPAVPGPVCVTGLQHVVPGTQDAIWAEFAEVWAEIVTPAGQQPFGVIANVPDPLCVGPDFGPVCVTGLRALAAGGYGAAGAIGGGVTYYTVCMAMGRPGCPIPIP